MSRRWAIVALNCVYCLTAVNCAQSAGPPAKFVDQFSTKSLVLRTSKTTTESRNLLTTNGRQYLESIQGQLPEPNATIVKRILQYPVDGSHKYWWPKSGESAYDGSTTDIVLNDVIVMKGEPKGRTFCCGLTLEIFYELAKLKPVLAQELQQIDPAEFKRYWFCRDINSPGPEDALTTYGIGRRVPFEEALPGDFVQIWRNDRSGHSVMFVNWLYDDAGNRAGLHYWSTQTSTSGIGFASEAFGPHPKQVNIQHVSVARPAVSH